MKQNTTTYSCKDCVHFLQHYAYTIGKSFKVDCGHCTKTKRGRFRKIDKICEEFKLFTKEDQIFYDKMTLENKINHILSDLKEFKEYFVANKKRED